MGERYGAYKLSYWQSEENSPPIEQYQSGSELVDKACKRGEFTKEAGMRLVHVQRSGLDSTIVLEARSEQEVDNEASRVNDFLQCGT